MNVSVVRLIVATRSSGLPEMPGSVASGTHPQDSHCVGKNSNEIPRKYKLEALLFEPTYLVHLH